MTVINKIMKFSAFILAAFVIFYLLFFVLKSSFKTESTIEQEKGSKKYFFETGIDISLLNDFTMQNLDKIVNYFSSSKDWKVYRRRFSKCRNDKPDKRSEYLIAEKRNGNGELIFVFSKIEGDFENFNISAVEEISLILTYQTVKKFRTSKEDKTGNFVNYSNFKNILQGKEFDVIIRPIKLYKEDEFKEILDIIESLKDVLITLQSYVNLKNIDDYLKILPEGSYKIQKYNNMIVNHNVFNEHNVIQEGNYIKANGYVNTGKKGSVYLKIIDLDSNRDISHPNVYNEEFVGWSENDSLKFWFELNEQHVPYGKKGDIFDTECQLWFRPYDNTQEFKIASVRKKIMMSERGF
ncbi:MAG: hypothetical protein PHF33_05330 [Candidatus Delongbacteria bacterium]|nr:hypothetical protein [Candidatus Delongbacteria bacterium]